MTVDAHLTIGSARHSALKVLDPQIDGAHLDVDILLAEALQVDRHMLPLLQEAEMTLEQQQAFRHFLERRLTGEPVAYITLSKEFWSLKLQVSHDTLVPRPETELVVERVLHLVSDIKRPRIADLGTGSGAIALALASELPNATLVATDASAPALAIARRNRQQLGLGNVEFRTGNWTEALAQQKFDIIVANPPYIASDDPCLNSKFMQHEPAMALIGGDDGLMFIREISAPASQFLNTNGWLVVEHGCHQAQAVQTLFESNGLSHCKTSKDLAELDRVTEGCATCR